MTEKYKPYQLHPYPWTHDRGTIKTAEGWVIGNFAYSLGDETDHSGGRLMTRSPEILEAVGLALRTIGDTLRHETLTPGGREALEMVETELRAAMHDQADKPDKKKPWVLINNNSHRVYKFESKRALLEYAKERGYEIKLGKYGPCDRTYYIESTEYIPGNR